MPEWLKGTDCKSVGLCLRRFESYSLHQAGFKPEAREDGRNLEAEFLNNEAGVAQLARVSAFQAEGCGFETRLPLQFRPCGSGVEHTLGKGEVESSSLSMGSTDGARAESESLGGFKFFLFN